MLTGSPSAGSVPYLGVDGKFREGGYPPWARLPCRVCVLWLFPTVVEDLFVVVVKDPHIDRHPETGGTWPRREAVTENIP